MILAVSPYHLTTREAPALVALLLADEVVTLVPSPRAILDDTPAHIAAHEASRRSAAFAEFGKAWAWCAPLWREGVLRADLGGVSPVAEFERVAEMIRIDDRFSPLRVLMRDEADAGVILDAISRDLLKGGPDPAYSVPIAAAMDRFSTREAIFVLRAGAHSIAQKAEQRFAKPLFSAAIPVLVQADAERLMHARQVLRTPREDLAAVFQEVPLMCGNSGMLNPRAAEGVAGACERFSLAFAELRDEIFRGSKDDDVRAIEGVAVLSAAAMPSDAVLRSSVQAMQSFSGRRSPAAPTSSTPSTLPAVFDPVEGRWLATLVVKVAGAPKRR
ncbi:MAG: hypothetical protein GC200_06595 [Tepidisphaera sp.]|nr:hypothetical protein [Tepidisphaera sp.]